ncbi:MAG: LacI family DNA-binding transcriptional regulator [Actinomycetota bacterium]
MARRDATLHDVARKVGVSTRTVSRVVRGEQGFSAETEAKVRAAIEELGYRPNLLARGLVSGRSGTIGLVGGDMSDPFFPELADGVQRAARDRGITMFFGTMDNEPDRQQSVLDSLVSHGADGVIVFPAAGTDEQLRGFAEAGLRIVSVDHPVTGHNISAVMSDITGGAHAAVGHLRERGRSRIGFIGNATSVAQRRRGAYEAALGDEAEVCVELDEATSSGGIAATARLIERHPDLDGIFAYNDVMAIGAIQHLTASGRRIPDDIAIVGFDDIEVGAFITPPLSTVRIDRLRLGRTAVDLLLTMMNGERTEVTTLLPVELIVRSSS